MTAPIASIASSWSGCRVGLAPTGKRRLCTAHAKTGSRGPYSITSAMARCDGSREDDRMGSVVSLSRQLHARRSFRPGVIMAGEIIPAIEKCDHIFLVEGLIAGLGKIGWNARKIKVYSVALRHRIDSVEIADPLILDQRRDRTLRNRQYILANGLPFRTDFSITDNVQSRLRCGSCRFLIVGGKRKYRRSDEHLAGNSTVDMKLVVILSANPHLNTDRRKHPRKRCRCQQYPAEEHRRVAIVTHRDPPHVPQYRSLRIEIGRADQQNSTFDPLSGDLLNERIVHVRLNQFHQRRVVSERRAFEQTMHVIGKNVLPSVFCKNLAQLTVMLSPQERERGNQRARADARYQIERWPRARIAPADQEAGAEGAVFGTAGDGEKVRYRRMSLRPQ